MFEEQVLYCPYCKKLLEIDGSFTFEDAAGSSNWTKKYVCVNDECVLYEKSYWCDYGDFFSGGINYVDINKFFPDRKYAALNSYAKETEVSIYKKGLKEQTYLSPILTLWWLKPVIEHTYKGDKMGNVIKKGYKLKFLKKSDGRYSVYYSSPIRMFFWNINHIRRNNISHYKKNPKNKYAITSLIDELELRSWDKRWWRIWSRKWIKFRYKKLITIVQKKNDFLKAIEVLKKYSMKKKDYEKLVKMCPTDFDVLDTLLEFKYSGDFIEKLKRKRKFENILKETDK